LTSVIKIAVNNLTGKINHEEEIRGGLSIKPDFWKQASLLTVVTIIVLSTVMSIYINI